MKNKNNNKFTKSRIKLKISKTKKGFTLIELLAVIIVLAIVMVITIPVVFGSIKNAKQTSFNSAGESIVKYLDDNYKNCKLKNESIAKYDKAIFDADCNLIKDNLSKNVIINSGYSLDDIEKVELYKLESNNFSLVVYPNLSGKFSDTKMFAKGIYINDCWWLMPIGEENYKLIKYLGINHENGSINSSCGVTKENNLYSITIPSVVDGREIYSLSNDLFRAFNTNDDGDIIAINKFKFIEEITIEEGIVSIDDGVGDLNNLKFSGTFFGIGVDENEVQKTIESGLGALQNELNIMGGNELKINLPNSLKYIGDAAFGMSAIKQLNIPKDVKEIGDFAFAANTNLNNITFNNNLKKIGNGAFMFIDVVELNIPNSIEELGEYSFAANMNLQNLTFAGGGKLKIITRNSFSSCKIQSLTIPSSIEIIDDYAFYSNANLESLNIEEGVKIIGEGAFQETKIQQLSIPNSVTEIKNYAFRDNKNLKQLTFKEDSNLKSIGDLTFSNCNLDYQEAENPLIIPNAVEKIGYNAFSYYFLDQDDEPKNKNLKFIRFNGALKEDNSDDWYNRSNTTLNPE